jgi:hypothetical protein
MSMLGGYIKLMLEQIRNSQEDNRIDNNIEVQFILRINKNYNAHICKFSIIGVYFSMLRYKLCSYIKACKEH